MQLFPASSATSMAALYIQLLTMPRPIAWSTKLRGGRCTLGPGSWGRRGKNCRTGLRWPPSSVTTLAWSSRDQRKSFGPQDYARCGRYLDNVRAKVHASVHRRDSCRRADADGADLRPRGQALLI